MIARSTNAPVENYSIPSKQSFAVSSVSFWSDICWTLDSPVPGQTNKVGWEFQLHDQTWSTDREHEVLLEGFREVFWGMLNYPGWYGKTLKSGSAATFGVGMRELFRWMAFRGYTNFAELDGAAHARYFQDIPILLTSRYKFYGERFGIDDELFESSTLDHAQSSDVDYGTEDKFTYSQVAIRINILYFIYAQQESLSERCLPIMSTKPFGNESAGEVTKKLAKYVVKRIPPLPDEVALPILREALSWIDHKADDIISLQEQYLEAISRLKMQRLSNSRVTNLAKDEITGFTFKILPGESTPWRAGVVGEASHHPEHGKTFLEPTQVLRKLVMTTRGAGTLILQFLVGLRIGEVCSIEGGWNDEENLPVCVIRRFSKSGIMEMFFLKALLSKGVDQPREEEWLLGCRPVGSNVLPAPVRALIALEKIFRPWRALGNTDALLVNFKQPKSLPKQMSSVSRVTTAGLLRSIKQFCYYEVDLAHLSNENERGEDLVIYRETKGLCIRSHHGRKTFAAYVLETRSSLLKAVSQHFKHINIAMTEGAYFPVSSRFRGEAEAIRTSETIAFFVEAIQGRKIYGRMAELVEKYFGGREWDSVRSDYAELERKVAEIVETHDLRIFFADHGKCLIKANPQQSRCQDASGGASWNMDSPNYGARLPSMCSGCGCFAVDRSNLPFWKQRLDELTEVVREANESGRSREFHVHMARVDQAKKIVSLIERGAND